MATNQEQYIWAPSNIFDARDRWVTDRSGRTHLLALYAAGWSWGQEYQGMDIWSACALLNNRGCTFGLLTPDAAAADR